MVCAVGVHAEICTVPGMHVEHGVHWRSFVDGSMMYVLGAAIVIRYVDDGHVLAVRHSVAMRGPHELLRTNVDVD